jgi:hypothetical protein
MAKKIEWGYNILLDLVILISLIYAIINWIKIKDNGYLKLFPAYISVSLILSLFWFFKDIRSLGLLIQNFFILFEFFIFYNFFIKVLKQKKFRIFLNVLTTIFLISTIIIVSVLYTNQDTYINLFSFFSHNFLSELVVLENIFIVIPVLLYYITLFNRPYVKIIIGDPIFLVMTGILFCFTISTPVFAFMESIISRDKQIFIYLYMINDLAYIIMNLFFIKAFKSV